MIAPQYCYSCEDTYYSLADKIYIRDHGVCYICDKDPEADKKFDEAIAEASRILRRNEDET